LGYFEEFVAFDFLAIFQRQLILDFLKNLLPLGLGGFSEMSYSSYLHLTSFYGNMEI